jgi:energy-coupling factor transport system permease protein
MNALDPRLKIIWFFFYSILIFTVANLPTQLLLTSITLLMIFITGFKLPFILKKVKYLLLFLPVTFFIHLFFSTELWGIVTDNGLAGLNLNLLILPVFFTLRIADFIIFMSWMSEWIDADKLLDSLYTLLKPLRKIKIPVDDLFQMIFIAIRFFPILQQEYKKMDENWKNFTNKNIEEKRFVRLLNNLVTLVVVSFRRADKIAISMQVRGYGLQERSYYTHLKFHFRDMVFFCFSIIFFIIIQRIGTIIGQI